MAAPSAAGISLQEVTIAPEYQKDTIRVETLFVHHNREWLAFMTQWWLLTACSPSPFDLIF